MKQFVDTKFIHINQSYILPHPSHSSHSSPPTEMLDAGAKWAEIFAEIFHPLGGDYDMISRYPESEKTVRGVDEYTNAMRELRDTLNPELELIASRIMAPASELQHLMKLIRKNITKREHKVRFHLNF